MLSEAVSWSLHAKIAKMAYNRKNILDRILAIQTATLEQAQRGVSQEWVYWNIVYPNYRISRTTYYAYLGCNAKAEIKRIEAARAQEPELF